MAENKTYFFIGIKGTGMASLALLLKDLGNTVLGSDIEKETFTQGQLIDAGIDILNFDPKNIKPEYIVVKGNAFDDEHPEMVSAKEQGNQILTYPQAVEQVINLFNSIGVAGAHGKTTTTGLLSHTLGQLANTSYLIGDGVGHADINSDYFVFEADEYRRHFAPYTPDYSIITNVDFDHPDYFKDNDDVVNAFNEFSNHTKKKVFINLDDELSSQLNVENGVTFAVDNADANYQAQVVSKDAKGTTFTVLHNGQQLGDIFTPIAGTHGVIDTLSVVSLLSEIGFKFEDIKDNVATFPGVKRRFNIHQENGLTYVDDYAHHPNEIKTTIEAARQHFTDKKVVAIFQPHTYSRVNAFMEDYAKSLSKADFVYLTPIFGSAREESGTVSSEDIGKLIPNFSGILTDQNVAELVSNHKNDVLVFMGAGDIEKYEVLLNQ